MVKETKVAEKDKIIEKEILETIEYFKEKENVTDEMEEEGNKKREAQEMINSGEYD
jgi:hypothetical protein